MGDEYHPYFQSQRFDIYERYVNILKSNGHAHEQDGALSFKVSKKTQVIYDLIRGDVVREEEKDFVIPPFEWQTGFPVSKRR